mgnify:CR=1 FL=1
MLKVANNDKNSIIFTTFATTTGSGRGIVIRVGDNTSMGRIAILASGLESNPTPLSQDIDRFISIITYVSIFFGVLFERQVVGVCVDNAPNATPKWKTTILMKKNVAG